MKAAELTLWLIKPERLVQLWRRGCAALWAKISQQLAFHQCLFKVSFCFVHLTPPRKHCERVS